MNQEIKTSTVKILEYTLYIKKDYEKSILLWERKFKEFLSFSNPSKVYINKHKCDRDENCECVYLGLILLDIHLLNYKENELEYEYDPNNDILNQNTSSKKDLKSVIDKYYFNYNLYLPFTLMKYLCKCMIELLQFQEARALIENYLLYSTLKINQIYTDKKLNTGNIKSQANLFEIDINKYEELNEILIFDVILIMSGFNRAKAKIFTMKDDGIKNKFLDKWKEIVYQYTQEDDETKFKNIFKEGSESEIVYDSEKYDPEVLNKINNIIDNKSLTNFEIGKNYSNFEIKNSLLQKFYNTALNRKLLIILISIFALRTFYKVLTKTGIDEKLISVIKLVFNLLTAFLKKFKLFYAIQSFTVGIFKLLVNH
jgi:hypothetical protein